MNKFEFVAVLLSIIFGMGLANLLSGALRAFFQKELTSLRLGWTFAVVLSIAANWWSLFALADQEVWNFFQFFYLMLWSASHYLLAVAVYPEDFISEQDEPLRYRFLASAFLVLSILDMGESAIRGTLFGYWAYLLMMSISVTAKVACLLNPTPRLVSITGWLLFFVISGWVILARATLTGI